MSGVDALRTKRTRGPDAKLSDDHLRRLFALLAGANPRQLGFDFGLWTRVMIGELIRREFGVRLSLPTVGRVLKRLGMSPQKPLYRAYQQDPDRVREWKERTYPQIRAEADRLGASIFFADEASVRTDFHAGTTWGVIGQTPIVESTGERKAIKMISAINPRGLFRFQVTEGKMGAQHFIGFCHHLLAGTDTPIFLIIDGSSVHTAAAVKEFVRSTNGRLSLFFLPPYSPELNPDEWVWRNVKATRIGRAVPQGKDDLKNLAVSALHRLQKSPQILRGFFTDPSLAYIAQENP